MRVAIVTFDGFNELDSFIALGLLNRLSAQGWKAEITSPATSITSMNGVTIQAQQPLEFANSADIVLFGSLKQVEMAATCASALVRGENADCQALIQELRADLRSQLGLEPIPPERPLPPSGPGPSRMMRGPGGPRADGDGARGAHARWRPPEPGNTPR